MADARPGRHGIAKVAIDSVTDQNGSDASGLGNTAGVTWLTSADVASDVGDDLLGDSGATVSPCYQLTIISTPTVIAPT